MAVKNFARAGNRQTLKNGVKIGVYQYYFLLLQRNRWGGDDDRWTFFSYTIDEECRGPQKSPPFVGLAFCISEVCAGRDGKLKHPVLHIAPRGKAHGSTVRPESGRGRGGGNAEEPDSKREICPPGYRRRSGDNIRQESSRGCPGSGFANFAGLGQTLSSSQLLHWHVSLFFCFLSRKIK